MDIEWGHLHSLRLTDAPNAAVQVVPLYEYDAARTERELAKGLCARFLASGSEGRNLSGDDWDAIGDILDARALAIPQDIRVVCAVPQGEMGIQLCEVGSSATLTHSDVVSLDMLGERMGDLQRIATAIRESAASITVDYQKPGEEPTRRHLKPLALFQAPRKATARHAWPISVICDDLDKEEPNKTFLLSRMSGIALVGAQPEPDLDDDIPF